MENKINPHDLPETTVDEIAIKIEALERESSFLAESNNSDEITRLIENLKELTFRSR